MQTTSLRHAGALAMLALALGAARAAPPPAEVFFSDDDIGEAQLSPSGKRLALTTAKGAGRVGLVVLDLAPGGQLTRATQSATADVARVSWVNEDRLLFSLVDLTEMSMPTRAPGLFSVNADGTRLRMLVKRTGRAFINTGDGDDRVLEWNHQLLAVPEARAGEPGDEALLAEFSLDGRGTQTPVWVNTRTGMTRRFSAAGAPAGVVQWVLNSRGEARAVLTLNGDRVQAHWLPPGQSQWQPLFDAPVLQQPFKLESVDTDGTLYVSHVPKGERHSVLARYDAAAKAPADPPLVRTPGFDFVGQFVKDGPRLLGVNARADSDVSVWLDEGMKKFQAQVDRLMPGRLNRIDCRRCSQPDMVALVHSYNDHDPGKLWVYQGHPAAGEPKWRAIGRVREAVDPKQMAGLDLQTITARDGRELPVWVTRPDGAQGPLPAVVLVHGGPWMRGTAWRWNNWAQFIASRGYVVIEPEFRGSLGYGDDHFRAGFKQWGQAMQDDVTDALKWAQKQGLASDRACIAGASYGGYSALMGLAKDPDLYRCGIASVAVADLELLVQGSWWVPDDTGLARRLTLPDMVGDPARDAAMLAANSPVKLAAHMKAPLLLAYGEEDLRVPLAHGKRMRDALAAVGRPPEWVSYPGEGHGFSKPEHRLDFARRMEAFLARHLAPAAGN
ncbi:alpha/beta hydrolase family protein [Roseateles sp. DXS20W]|uniref:Alpha/beta hydrolase family protein n=1 Tax=Pelomonas lactea TaxID=3299030 RepID=A0ABW7GS43_9BURK